MRALAVDSKVGDGEAQADRLALAGGEQAGLGKAAEADRALLKPADVVRRAVIELHYVLAAALAGVCDLDLGGYLAARGAAADKLSVKARVGEAVAEGVLHLILGERLKVSVAYVDALKVLDVVFAALVFI